MIHAAPVVFCTHDSPTSIGGPFTWLRKLLPALRTLGVDSRILALTHYGATGPLVEGLRSDGFDVQAVDCHERTEDQVRWILQQLHASPPAVFVPNFVVSAYYAACWLKATGTATIGVLHSDDPFYRALQDEFLFGPSKYRLTDVVCVSEKLKTDVLRRAGDRGLDPVYIPYGVDSASAVQRDYVERFKIAYVGRLTEEQKRISLVTRSLIAACREVPGTEAVICGDGPDRAIVEKMLNAEEKGAAVRLVGAISSDRVQPELLECDAIALMSDYEGLPIALLEGMACGCIPICRMMDSGIPQLVDDRRSGMIVSDKPEDFVAAVRWLREHPSLADLMSQNARQLIEAKYSHDSSVQFWARLLSQYTNRTIGKLSIPRRLRLPPRRSELESAERRRKPDSDWILRLRRLRIRLGALRRRWFHQDHEQEA